MPDLIANRTLVKSPPELWSEVSEVESLARHLGEFGEIAISRLDPEHTVAWEGESASGTVQLEASGWGTKVTLSARLGEPEPPSADNLEESRPACPRESWLARWLFRQRNPQSATATTSAGAREVHNPETAHAQTVLEEALHNLGSAHHRPFSRG